MNDSKPPPPPGTPARAPQSLSARLMTLADQTGSVEADFDEGLEGDGADGKAANPEGL